MRFQFTYLIFFQNHSSTLFVPAATWDSYQILGYSQVSLLAVLLLVFCQTSLEGSGLSSSVAFSAGCSILFPHLLQRFGFLFFAVAWLALCWVSYIYLEQLAILRPYKGLSVYLGKRL